MNLSELAAWVDEVGARLAALEAKGVGDGVSGGA